METHKITAKDFFFHLGLLISLYAGVGFLLNLLFSVINAAFPAVSTSYYYNPSISFPVAALVILTPVFLFLSYVIAKSEITDPSKKEIWIKRWSTYLTMFVTGIVVVGDLITVLYYFLDGRDLTTAFLLKIVSILVVLGAVFGYFWMSLNEKLTSTNRKIWRVGVGLLVIVSIILGFVVIGSPQTQRSIRYDNQRVADLQMIQGQIVTYWQSKGVLPKTTNDLKDSLSSFTLPVDPQTKTPYIYTVNSNKTFELCANFNLDARNYQTLTGTTGAYYNGDPNNENWAYKKGAYCFQRTIDSQLYPLFNKGAPSAVTIPAVAQ